jgi:hypothetical protein
LGKSPLAVEREFWVESNFVGLCFGRAFQSTLHHIFSETQRISEDYFGVPTLFPIDLFIGNQP